MIDSDLSKEIAYLIYRNSGVSRCSMDTLWCRMLAVFEDGKPHTYAEVHAKVLSDRYPLGWNKGGFLGIQKRGYIRHLDRRGKNHSIRYVITEDGLNVLLLARQNTKVFRFLRHFKDKYKDNYYSKILEDTLTDTSGEAIEDLSPAGFLKAVEALCSSENDLARSLGNFDAYTHRLWNLIEKTSALDSIVGDPEVLRTMLEKSRTAESSIERSRWLSFYDRLKGDLDWKETVRRSHEVQ